METTEPAPAQSPVASRFPLTVMIAALIWIGLGGWIAVVMAWVAYVLFGPQQAVGKMLPNANFGATESVIATLVGLGLLGGVALTAAGARAVRGTATGTLRGALGSLAVGVLAIGLGLEPGTWDSGTVAWVVVGGALVVAAVLATGGGGRYRAWRASRVASDPARRR